MRNSDVKILIRGGGDLATGTIAFLYQCGYRLLVLENDRPTSIRRTVSFSEAVYDGTTVVEGIRAKKIDSLSEAEACWREGLIPILCDSEALSVKAFEPDILIDAVIAKRNVGTRIDMAPLVIGLGPGFTAGVDVHLVIETQRGHRLGRIISEGCAAPNTGIPGIIAGYGKERVMHSENAGIFTRIADIGDLVHQGDILGYIGDVPLKASIDGVLRGILKEGLFVPAHFKMADIDPRIAEQQNCYTISDKARTIAGAVLLAIVKYLEQSENRKAP